MAAPRVDRGWGKARVVAVCAVCALTLAALVTGEASAGPRAAAGATSWYFAEGYTGQGFDEYLTIMNPSAASSATITYYVERATTPVARTVALAANSRTTVAVHAPQSAGNPGGLGRQPVGHSIKVESLAPVVVERPMYFAYGVGINGGHNVMGARGPAATWYFAEGYTGTGFDEYLTIMNPGAAGDAEITYYVEGEPAPVARTVPLAANSRTTVSVHAPQSAGNPGGLGPGRAHSTKVEATVPVVVERPMYFAYGDEINGGHNVMGVNAPRQSWLFAEGYTGTGFDEYLTIQNPGGAGEATISYYVEGQPAPTTRLLSLAPNSRTTVVVHDLASAGNPGGLGRGLAHSTKVEATVPVVVERPMYFAYAGVPGVTGGHNVMGASLPGVSWSFAEGYTGAGFDEYLTMMNPGGAGSATVTYFVEGAANPATRVVPLAANSRTTVVVHAAQGAGNPGGLGRGSAHSIKVDSTMPVVVERPMYFAYGVGINGGHNVMGYAAVEFGADSYHGTVLADAPASYWRLGETSGTVAADLRGAAPGAYTDGVTLGQPGAIGGAADASAGFVGGYVGFGDRYDFAGRTAFTLEAWVYPTVVDDSFPRIISKESFDGATAPATRQGYTLGFHQHDGLFCGRYADKVANEAVAAPGVVPNAWNHIVCAYDGTTIRLYLNGTRVASVASAINLADTALALTLGQKTNGGNAVTGRIDEVAVYPTALSDARIAEHYAAATR